MIKSEYLVISPKTRKIYKREHAAHNFAEIERLFCNPVFIVEQRFFDDINERRTNVSIRKHVLGVGFIPSTDEELKDFITHIYCL